MTLCICIQEVKVTVVSVLVFFFETSLLSLVINF